MDNTILRPKHHSKAFQALKLFSLLFLIQRVGATEFQVGGSKEWTVPTDPNAFAYNQWAEMKRFQIGDSLLFIYPADKDSVFQVNKEDFTNCNIARPIACFTDGHTSFKFNQSGPYYFISGIQENCNKNEKMVVVVLVVRGNQAMNSNETNTASPPSPSPSGSIEIIPSPAPVGEESPYLPPPPPSGASSIIVSFIGSVGAFAGSSLLFVL
ncbi:hypothetical protein HHK36_002202 [Tetracentron sinense]|uniref:Phytocyanin domain-containing protein n=1 Tax=Tetracentron sinense TaxID=13715 RepID=A0A835A536_TETSI|nr:hypothetical protein HHK36_002202 [Tetracentron sinense]